MKKSKFFGWVLVLALLVTLGGAVSASTAVPVWNHTTAVEADHTSPAKQPVPFCGNDTTEPGEACDGTDLNGYDCSTVMTGFTGGTLACRFDCSGYDVSQCVSGGHTVHADSCNRDDVEAAIQAASDGDTVVIPAGTCTWTSATIIDPMPAITIQGAGIGQTIITNSVPATGWLDTLLWIVGVEGKPFRLTGIEFRGGTIGGDSYHGTILVHGGCKNWRIDHCRFYHLNNRAVLMYGYNYGVIDHCDFTNYDNHQTIYVTMANYGGSSWGDASWAADAEYGTANAMFVEDCVFRDDSGGYGHGFIDMCYGARVVVRHSEFYDECVVSHGADSGGRYRSFRTVEVYNNTFHAGQFWINAPIGLRGGTGVIHDNVFTGYYANGIYLWLKRLGEYWEPWGECDEVRDYWCSNDDTLCTGDGDCSAGGTCTRCCTDVFDGDTLLYCRDQPGRGKDTGPLSEQDLEPLYEWNNTLDGADADFWVTAASHLIQENRDYYNDTLMPGYTPYVYPHPLVREDLPLELQGSPGNRAIYLDWTVNARLPTTSTWQIDYEGPAGDQTPPITGIVSPTRSYTLTGLTNYAWYTVTLNAMLGNTPLLSDTVRVMPTDMAIFLPLVWRMR